MATRSIHPGDILPRARVVRAAQGRVRYRTATAILLLLGSTACATAKPPPYIPEPDQLRREAIDALQGATPDPFFTDEQLGAVAEAIVAVRNRSLEVRGIEAAKRLPLMLALTDSAWATFVARFPDAAGDTLRPWTGLHQIDSLNAALSARGVRITDRRYTRSMYVVFTRPPNVPVLTALYQRSPDVGYAGPTMYIGVRSWMAARLHGDTVRLILTSGWGDCLSGCIYSRTYEFTYDRRTRRVTQVSDSGDPTPTAGLDAWMRRPDWAAFDRMPEETRTAWVAAMARDPRTPFRLLREVVPRLRTLDANVSAWEMIERPDVRRDAAMLTELALGVDGSAAHAVLFDEHGLVLARNRRAPPAAIRALLEEYTRRDPPPLEISLLLVRNPVVQRDREMLLHLLREAHMLEEVQARGCRAFAERGHPYWERMETMDGSVGQWYSRVPCPELRVPVPAG